jgi:hypothetical protein
MELRCLFSSPDNPPSPPPLCCILSGSWKRGQQANHLKLAMATVAELGPASRARAAPGQSQRLAGETSASSNGGSRKGWASNSSASSGGGGSQRGWASDPSASGGGSRRGWASEPSASGGGSRTGWASEPSVSGGGSRTGWAGETCAAATTAVTQEGRQRRLQRLK